MEEMIRQGILLFFIFAYLFVFQAFLKYLFILGCPFTFKQKKP